MHPYLCSYPGLHFFWNMLPSLLCFLKLIFILSEVSSLQVEAFCITTFKCPLQFHLFCEDSSDCHFWIYVGRTQLALSSTQCPVPLSYYSIFFCFQRRFCLLTSHEIYLHVFTVYFFSLPSIIVAVTGACFSFLFASVCWAVGIVLGKLGLPISSWKTYHISGIELIPKAFYPKEQGKKVGNLHV